MNKALRTILENETAKGERDSNLILRRYQVKIGKYLSQAQKDRYLPQIKSYLAEIAEHD